MAAPPTVSVIIPTYNSAAFVAEAVESVRRQSFANIEIIVVDDGSTDDTARVLEPYRRSGAVHYESQPNQGPSAARNAGIRAARGHFLAFLDADDTIPPHSVERRVRFLQAHPEVDVVFTDCRIRDRAGDTSAPHLREYGFLRKVGATIASREGDEVVFEGHFFEAFFEHRICTLTGNFMIRRGLDGRVPLFEEGFTWGDITEYWFRLCRRYRVGFIDEPLFDYHRYRSVLTRRHFDEGLTSYIRLEAALAEELERQGQASPRFIALIRRRIAYYYASQGWYLVHSGEPAQARGRFRRGLAFNAAELRCYAGLAAACVPARQFRRLKRVKRLVAAAVGQIRG